MERVVTFLGPNGEACRGERALQDYMRDHGFALDPKSSESDYDDDDDDVVADADHQCSGAANSVENECSESSSIEDEDETPASEETLLRPMEDAGYFIGVHLSICEFIEQINLSSKCKKNLI